MARKQMLGVTLVDVSQVSLDIEGLKKNWLGRGLPGLTKEGVVRWGGREKTNGERWGGGAGSLLERADLFTCPCFCSRCVPEGGLNLVT